MSSPKQVYTPFHTDSKFELDLYKDLPATSAQLALLHTNHVWTCPDIGFTCISLAEYIQAPSASSFTGVHQCLSHAIASISIFFFVELLLNWLGNWTTIMCCASFNWQWNPRGLCWCQTRLVYPRCCSIHRLSFQTHLSYIHLGRQTTLHWYSWSKFSYLHAEHIDVHIHCMHHQIAHGKFVMRKIGSAINPADSGTNPNSSPVHFCQLNHTAEVQFYPPPDSEHAILMSLKDFVPYTLHSKWWSRNNFAWTSSNHIYMTQYPFALNQRMYIQYFVRKWW